MTRVVARHQPGWYQPDDLPEEVIAFGDPVRGGLGVGAAGKVGLLELTLGPSGGCTRLRRHYQRAPLHVYRPIYLDPGRPDMAFVYLQQSGDGLVQGDRYRIDIDCAAGAAAHITTQAATKVYRADRNLATQLVNITVGAGAVLEYLPDPTIPFRGSRFFQRTRVTVEPTATAILGETVLPGRVAHGECHAYDHYWAETEIRRPEGGLLAADVMRLSPAAGDDPASLGLLGGYHAIGTLFVITARADPTTLVERLRSALEPCPEILAGVSGLPNGCGASVRLLAATATAARLGMHAAWNTARLVLLGAPAPDLRKG